MSSPSHLADLVREAPVLMWLSDAAGRWTLVSARWLEVTGRTLGEEIGCGWLHGVHPADRERVAAACANAREPIEIEFRLRGADGEYRTLLGRSTPQDDDVAIGVALDISARSRANETLRFLVTVSEILATSLDIEQTVGEATRLAVTILGDWCAINYTEGDTEMPRRLAAAHRDPAKEPLIRRLLATPPKPLLNSATAVDVAQWQPTILNDVPAALIEQASQDAEHAAIARGLGVASMLIAPLVARDRFLGAVTFSSAQRGAYDNADAELALLFARRVAVAIDNAELYRDAVASSNAKDEFLATVSHELRTPMTATLGWVRMLRLDDLDDATRATALDAIELSTRAQAKLIEDILDASSIILGKFRLDRAPVDLAEVIDAAMKTVAVAAEAKSIALHVDLSRWSGVLFGDADRLQQVVWNLVTNAIKFGRRGGRIDVVVERAADRARIVVTDDGAGIDAHFLPQVFDRFRQADSGTSRTQGGLGLGLSIVRHLVELHGGSVSAKSDGLGRGAAFTVELPAGG